MNNFPKDEFENSDIFTSNSEFFKEHRFDMGELLISTKSWADWKNEAAKINEPTSTFTGPENFGNSPDMVRLSPIWQSMSLRPKLTSLGFSTQRIFPKLSKTETVPNSKLACKVATAFACMHVIAQENIVAVSCTPMELTLPKIQATLLGENLDPSTAKMTFFSTPDQS